MISLNFGRELGLSSLGNPEKDKERKTDQVLSKILERSTPDSSAEDSPDIYSQNTISENYAHTIGQSNNIKMDLIIQPDPITVASDVHDGMDSINGT